MPSLPSLSVYAVPVIFYLAAGPLVAQSDLKTDASKPDPRAARIRQMKEVAAGIRGYRATNGIRETVELIPEPMTRFDDAARADEDGTVWMWGRAGRPIAVMELYKKIHGTPGWIMAMASLSTGRVGLEGPAWLWAPDKPGLEMKPHPQSPAPSLRPPARLRQIKDMAARYSAHEFWDPNNQRSELRLIPKPVCRYNDPGAEVVDGAIFLFCHGTNPEVVLLIEALGKNGSPSAWQYGLQRLGHAEMHVNLDAHEIWQCPRVDNVPPNEPYFLVIVPAAQSAN
jgi:hypothetical protein